MEAWFLHIFNMIPGGTLFLAAVFIITFLEALVGIGLLMPGSVLTVFSGWLAYQGKAPAAFVMASAGCGAILGDITSYWLGAHFGVHLWRWRPLKKKQGLLKLTEVFFHQHGGKSVFIGRFLGPIRGLVPFVAGASQMRPALFTIYAVISGIFWGICYPGIGFLGGSSWERAETLAGRFGLLVTLGIIVGLIFLWLRHKFLPRKDLNIAKHKSKISD